MASYVATCARTANGTVACWGDNEFGQIGDGSSGYRLYQPTPTAVQDSSGAALGGIIDLASSGYSYHFCARTRDGRPWCWGSNVYAELGIGTAPTQTRAVQSTALSCP